MHPTNQRIVRRLLMISMFVPLVALLVFGQLAAQDVRAAEPELVCTETQLNPDNDIPETVADATPTYLALTRDDGQDTEIFVQNRSTGVVTQITDNSYDDILPRMEAHNVVWQFENPVNGTWDIALHNMITGITQIIGNSPRRDHYARIEGDHVVWAIYGPPSSVSHYNIATGVTQTIALRYVGDHRFYVTGISAGKVLYSHEGLSGKVNLYVHDLETGQKMLVTGGVPASDKKGSAEIHGNVVVWQNYNSAEGAASNEIYAFHLGTQKLTQITNNDVADLGPALYGDYIVYRRITLNSNEIHLYSLQTGVTDIIASSATVEYGSPVIDGMRVSWYGTDGIYVYDIPIGVTAKASSYAGKNGGLIAEGTFVFWHEVPNDNDVDIHMADCGFAAEPVQLLPNADFEMDADNDKLPDGWSAKGTTLDKSDKLKRNKLKDDGSIKQFAYSGETAFMFRGNPDGQKSKLQYKVSDFGIITDGSRLEFSVYMKRFNVAPGTAIGKVKINFSDGSKKTLQLAAPAAQGYASVSDSLVIDLDGRQIEKIKVQFSTNLTSGKFLIDTASLLVIPAGASDVQKSLIPLP